MNVSEFSIDLKAGELKKLFVKTSESDILGFINQGILDLYKKFPLWRDSVTVTPVTGVKDYAFDGYDSNAPIDLRHAQLLLIEEVTATDTNNNLFTFVPTNSTKPQNFSTPFYNVLRMNGDYEGYGIEVDVRLAPLALRQQVEDIPLPPQLIPLLTLYVAYKAHGSVNVDMKSENNTYYMRYTSEVGSTIQSGQYPLDDLEYSGLNSRGFM